jgi:hypothetical protein
MNFNDCLRRTFGDEQEETSSVLVEVASAVRYIVDTANIYCNAGKNTYKGLA